MTATTSSVFVHAEELSDSRFVWFSVAMSVRPGKTISGSARSPLDPGLSSAAGRIYAVLHTGQASPFGGPLKSAGC